MTLCERCGQFEATSVLKDERLCVMCWSRLVYSPHADSTRAVEANTRAGQRALDVAEEEWEKRRS